jgi:hypothetical protein
MGLERVACMFTLVFAAYNLIRMRHLLPAVCLKAARCVSQFHDDGALCCIHPRRSNATLLQNGKLVTGGSSGSGFDDSTNPFATDSTSGPLPSAKQHTFVACCLRRSPSRSAIATRPENPFQT